jgi:hypothetical protein
MGYSNWKIFKTVVTGKKQKLKSFLFYDQVQNVICDTYWCYNTEEVRMKLSEITPQYDPSINGKKYKLLAEDMKANGLNYKKGMITIKINSDNVIGDGNHRYKILKQIYGPDYEISVLKIKDKFNPLLHLLFVYSIIKPLRLIYKLLRLPKILISRLLSFFLTKKSVTTWIF